jgi:hypothetical protein
MTSLVRANLLLLSVPAGVEHPPPRDTIDSAVRGFNWRASVHLISWLSQSLHLTTSSSMKQKQKAITSAAGMVNTCSKLREQRLTWHEKGHAFMLIS